MFETSSTKYDWINPSSLWPPSLPTAPSRYFRGFLILFAAVRHLRRRHALWQRRKVGVVREHDLFSSKKILLSEDQMTKLTSFEADIRPLFTDRDIRAMSKAFNLGSYNDVKTHASAIYDRIRGLGGAIMPPPPPRGEGPWPQSRIDLFAKWMAEGYQP
jgi:hypothetical protein